MEYIALAIISIAFIVTWCFMSSQAESISELKEHTNKLQCDICLEEPDLSSFSCYHYPKGVKTRKVLKALMNHLNLDTQHQQASLTIVKKKS